MNITVFLGAPGSGKGTQAKRLSQSHHFSHLSTGDMLRAAMQQGSETGVRAKSFVDRGELVPDQIMIEIIDQVLDGLSENAKVILDGFPRTVPQAKALDQNPKTRVNSALYFAVPQTTLVSRLTGRRICEKCGESYHTLFIPPQRDGACDKCGARLIQRTDDAETVVQRRLEVFEQQNRQLLDYYSQEKKLHQLDGDKPADTLQDEIVRMLR